MPRNAPHATPAHPEPVEGPICPHCERRRADPAVAACTDIACPLWRGDETTTAPPIAA